MSRANRNINWIEKYCRVPEGAHVGKKLHLRDWQREILKGIYDADLPLRRAIISFPRKNGKTSLSALLLLLHLAGPEYKRNSQLFSAAQSRDQAAILFSLAAKMVRMDEHLNACIRVRDHEKQLFCEGVGTLYRALSADASTAYGLSPSFVVHDELGQVKGPKSDLYEALETAAAAQESPLSIVISTQSPTDGDLLSILIDDAQAGGSNRTKLWLWSAPEEADPFDIEVIRACNPAFGDFQNADEVLEQADSAKRMPSRENSYRNLILNQRISIFSPFLSKNVFESCNQTPSEPAGYMVWCGLDLSARTDLTAFVLIWQVEGVWQVLPYFWTPEQGLLDRARRDRAPYDIWMRQGYLETTPGHTVDYEWVATRIGEILSDCEVAGVAFDRWRIDVFKKELDRLGLELPLVPYGQGFKDQSPALDALEAAFLNGKIAHGGHPVLTMCAANAVVVRDPAGNRKLDKVKSTGRIDGMAALANAIGGATMKTEEEPSIYETRPSIISFPC
jgi:phage terminase large subunit-like protein